MGFGAIFKKAYKRYVLDAMSGLAYGLFATLIIGLVLAQLSQIPFLAWIKPYADVINAKSQIVGAAIGVGIAYFLKVKPLAMLASAGTGAFGYVIGGPLGSYFAAVVGSELGHIISGKTKVDIMFVPAVTIVAGCLTAQLLSPPINYLMEGLQRFINSAMLLSPVFMGIIVSVVFGIVITTPISSAGLAAVLFTVSGDMPIGLALAAGAATVGCATHMVGFAVASYDVNGMAGLLAQGMGTSKLQMSNVFRKPIVILPAVFASAIAGPLSSTIFQMKNYSSFAGMGTCSFVGQIGTYTAMASEGLPMVVIKIALIHYIIPAALTFMFATYMKKKNWIKPNDMKLEL